jgi:Zinc-binding loop region of homing endonuclease
MQARKGPLPGGQGAELGCFTIWSENRGVWGPKVPTAGGKKGEPRQYVQLGGTEKVLAHRLGWVFQNPDGKFTSLTDDKVEASHLCFRARCCNGMHLAMEPRAYNQSRSYCLWQWEDRTVYPARTIDVCPHFPKCLRRGEIYESVIAPWTAAKKLESEPIIPSIPQELGDQPKSSILLSSLNEASENPPESQALSDDLEEVSDDFEIMMAQLG